jgi:predicted dehydrogenase
VKPTRRQFIAAGTATLAAAHIAKAQSAPTYKACVIGDTKQGGYGHTMHLVWALRDDVKVVGLADPDEEGRAKHAEEAGAERTYADYQEMLEKEKPDLCVIGPRWTINHKDYLLACADAGCHGMMEKPIATDLAEADAMIDAIESKNLKWSIAFNFRSMPVIDHVRKLIYEDKIIGSPMEIRSRGKEDGRAGGEDLIVLGTHIFDLIRFFIGDPHWCQSDITHNGKPATPADVREATEPLGPIVGNRIHAMYGFDRGVAGYFSSMITADGNGGRWGLDICGSQGIISVRADVNPVIHLLRDSTWAPGDTGKQWEPLPGGPFEGIDLSDERRERHKYLINDLMAAIEEDRMPRYSLQDGRASYEMIQAVNEAYVQGERVGIPLENRDHPLKRWA